MSDSHRALDEFGEFGEIDAPRPEPTAFEVISRRRFLGKAIGTGATAFIASVGTMSLGRAATGRSNIAFPPVSANRLDTVTLPPGFRWHVVASWGDPLW